MSAGSKKILFICLLFSYVYSAFGNPMRADMISREKKTRGSPLGANVNQPNERSERNERNDRNEVTTYTPMYERANHQQESAAAQLIRNSQKLSKMNGYNSIHEDYNGHELSKKSMELKEANLKDKNHLDMVIKETPKKELTDKQRISRQSYRNSGSDEGSKGYYESSNVLSSAGGLVLDLHLKMDSPGSEPCCEEDYAEASASENRENCWKVDGKWQCLVTTPVDCEE